MYLEEEFAIVEAQYLDFAVEIILVRNSNILSLQKGEALAAASITKESLNSICCKNVKTQSTSPSHR